MYFGTCQGMPGITDPVVFETRICFVLGIDILLYPPWPWCAAVGWPQVLGEHGVGCGTPGAGR